jgi:hypothetical protein
MIARSVRYKARRGIFIPSDEFEAVVSEFQEAFPKAPYNRLSLLAYEALEVTDAQRFEFLPD